MIRRPIVTRLAGIAVAGSLILATSGSTPAPGVHLAYGQSVTVDCPGQMALLPVSATYVTVDCPQIVAASNAPSLTPAPTASPSAAPSPTPSPTALAGIPVPGSIDSTGAADDTAALLAFFGTVPNGSTIIFKAGGTYRVNTALKIGGRSNLTFNGNGATLKAGGTGFNENYSGFYFQTFPGTNTGIRVTNFKLVGSDPTPGTFTGGQEGQHGVLLDGGNGFEIDHNTFSAMYGDGVEVNSGAQNVHIHDNTFTNTGRNGLSVITGSHVEFDHNVLGTMGYMPFDIEPNTPNQPSSFVSIHDNQTNSWTNAWFAIDGSQTGAALNDISVFGNVSNGKSLLTVVTGPGRKKNVTFVGNKGGPGTATFSHVDGLIATGNTGLTVVVNDCPGAVIAPNP